LSPLITLLPYILSRKLHDGLADVAQAFEIAYDLGVDAESCSFMEATSDMHDPTLPLEGLSPVNSKALVARFDGGSLSSDSGLIALAEVEKRLRVAATLAACIDDPRRPEMVSRRLDEMIGFRMSKIAAGYEDADDASRLRTDPVFKMAGGRLPCDEDLAS